MVMQDPLHDFLSGNLPPIHKIHSIGEFDEAVRAVADYFLPVTDSLLDVTPVEATVVAPSNESAMSAPVDVSNLTPSQRAIRMAAIAHDHEAAGVHWWTSDTLEGTVSSNDTPNGISNAETIMPIAPIVAGARLAQLRNHKVEPTVDTGVYGDLGGGRSTYYNEGTLDPLALADVVQTAGWVYDPHRRIKVRGIDVVLGDRHIGVPINESLGDSTLEQNIEEATRILRRGGGSPIRKKQR